MLNTQLIETRMFNHGRRSFTLRTAFARCSIHGGKRKSSPGKMVSKYNLWLGALNLRLCSLNFIDIQYLNFRHSIATGYRKKIWGGWNQIPHNQKPLERVQSKECAWKTFVVSLRRVWWSGKWESRWRRDLCKGRQKFDTQTLLN